VAVGAEDGGCGGAPAVDDSKVIVMLCEADRLATLVAVIVTLVDVGMVAGAV
jgi:hypothetical protein